MTEMFLNKATFNILKNRIGSRVPLISCLVNNESYSHVADKNQLLK